jgi:transposase
MIMKQAEDGSFVSALPVDVVEISALVFSWSPRLTGEIIEHSRLLAEVKTASLPPILVHRQTMWVIDGRHRVHAAQIRGQHQIAARFFEGTKDEAFLLAVRENVAHGLPLSRADRRAAAVEILRIHPDWSNRLIADAVGLSDSTIRKVRQQYSAELSAGGHNRVGRDGRTRPLNGTTGRRRASAMIRANPDLALRSVARTSGVSLSTAHDVRQRIRRGEDPVPPSQRHDKPPAAPTSVSDLPTQNHSRQAKFDLRASLSELKEDPCLRYSQAGREMLRRLEADLVEPTEWGRWLTAVPAHRAEAVAILALASAETWQALAGALKKR